MGQKQSKPDSAKSGASRKSTKAAAASDKRTAGSSSHAPTAASQQHDDRLLDEEAARQDAELAALMKQAEAMTADATFDDDADADVGDVELLNDEPLAMAADARQDSAGSVELTEDDLKDPALLRQLAAMDEDAEADGDGGDGGEGDEDDDDDLEAKLVREVGKLAEQVVEKCRKGDETEAAHLYKECVTLRKDLRANLGADAEDPTPRLLDACLNARKAAFALNASGDKEGARANLTLHKTLKAVLTANGVDVPAK
jgi:hypothetical protein